MPGTPFKLNEGIIPAKLLPELTPINNTWTEIRNTIIHYLGHDYFLLMNRDHNDGEETLINHGDTGNRPDTYHNGILARDPISYLPVIKPPQKPKKPQAGGRKSRRVKRKSRRVKKA